MFSSDSAFKPRLIWLNSFLWFLGSPVFFHDDDDDDESSGEYDERETLGR